MRTLLAMVLLLSTASAAEPYAWTAPGPHTQLEDDTVAVERGKGAVFIPAMTSVAQEPRVFIVDGDRVMPVRIGEKIPLDPGRYVVLVGSSGPEHSVGVPVRVEEGRVTLVPVEWGGLQVELVNPKLEPTDQPYQLIDVASGDVLSVLPELWSGDAMPTTWLLPPGLYRVQSPESEGDLRPDFASVYVPEGGLTKLRVFVDRAGRFRGNGVVDATDDTLDPEERGPIAGSLVAGLAGSLTQSSNVVGAQNFALAEGSLFIDGHLDVLSRRHQLLFDVHAEEGALYLRPSSSRALPWVKSQDRLEGLLSYTFLLNEGAGLYARGGAHTQIFPTKAIATEDLDVTYEELDGTTRTESIDAAETYDLNDDFFAPVAFKAGAGLKSRLSTLRDVEVAVYAGAAMRGRRFRGAYLPDDDESTDAIEVRAIDDFTLFGPEIGANVGFRINGFASYNGNIDWFGPIDHLDEFIIESGHSVSLRFTRALSVSYRLDFAYVPQITDEIMVRQGLSLRLAWTVL